MKTIKRTIKEVSTIEKEVEITLPYYSRSESGNYHYKVFGEGSLDAIQVRIDHSLYSIGITAVSNAFNEDVECSESEFEKAYSKVLTHLQINKCKLENEMLNQF